MNADERGSDLEKQVAGAGGRRPVVQSTSFSLRVANQQPEGWTLNFLNLSQVAGAGGVYLS
jgi:hypothetical protein